MKRLNCKLNTYIVLSILLCTTNLSAQWSKDPTVNNLVGFGVPIMAVSDELGGAFILINPDEDLFLFAGIFSVNKFGFVRFPYLPLNKRNLTFITGPNYGMINDGRNGVYISFDLYNLNLSNIFNSIEEVVIHRIDSSGVQLWGQDGLTIAEKTFDKIEFISIISDADKGSIIFWIERPDSNDPWELKTQRVDPVKNKLWGENGISIANMVTDEMIFAEMINNQIYSSYTGIQDSAANKETRYIQKISNSGELVWANPVEVNVRGKFIDDGFGGIVTAGVLFDSSSNSYSVTAQRIDKDGVKLWGEDGVTVSHNATIKTKNVSIHTDSKGNYVFVWNLSPFGNNDIFAQKLNNSGEKQWNFNDIMIGDPNWEKRINIEQGVVSDGNLNTIIIWRRASGEFRGMYGQMIDKDGIKRWGANEVTISSQGFFGVETEPVIVSDHQGGAIAFWYNTNFHELFSQNINSQGILGEVLTTSVKDDDPSTIPQNFRLFQNYPNPFNPVTTIEFQIPQAQNVKISIYNLLGQEIERLVDRSMPAGFYSVIWNAADFSSGIYMYTIQAGRFSDKKRLTLIK